MANPSEKKVSLVQEAYEILKNLIISIKIPPGQIVSDFTLSKKLEMSRTPIREALIWLRNDGLVIDKDGSTIVTELSVSDLKEIFEARAGIEGIAANLMAGRGLKPEERNDLKEMHQRIIDSVQSNNIYDSFKKDDDFHLYIIRAYGNSRLIDFHNKLNLQVRRFRWLTFLSPSRSEDTISEHQEILEALISDDPIRAESAVRKHINLTKASYEGVLTNIAADERFRALQYYAGNQ